MDLILIYFIFVLFLVVKGGYIQNFDLDYPQGPTIDIYPVKHEVILIGKQEEDFVVKAKRGDVHHFKLDIPAFTKEISLRIFDSTIKDITDKNILIFGREGFYPADSLGDYDVSTKGQPYAPSLLNMRFTPFGSHLNRTTYFSFYAVNPCTYTVRWSVVGRFLGVFQPFKEPFFKQRIKTKNSNFKNLGKIRKEFAKMK